MIHVMRSFMSSSIVFCARIRSALTHLFRTWRSPFSEPSNTQSTFDFFDNLRKDSHHEFVTCMTCLCTRAHLCLPLLGLAAFNNHKIIHIAFLCVTNRRQCSISSSLARFQRTQTSVCRLDVLHILWRRALRPRDSCRRKDHVVRRVRVRVRLFYRNHSRSRPCACFVRCFRVILRTVGPPHPPPSVSVARGRVPRINRQRGGCVCVCVCDMFVCVPMCPECRIAVRCVPI